MSRHPRLRPGVSRRDREKGQGLVELAIITPFFLLLLMAMAEFGFVFSHHLTITYATREGARTGAALAAGTTDFPCTGGGQNIVDTQIIAAVQRVLTSPGSQVNMARVSQIRIYQASPSGAESGPVNIWTRGLGPVVDGVQLQFTNTGYGWNACNRDNGTDPDSLGVSISYTYDFVTPLSALFRFFGGPGAASLSMTDRTVMALNPTQ